MLLLRQPAVLSRRVSENFAVSDRGGYLEIILLLRAGTAANARPYSGFN